MNQTFLGKRILFVTAHPDDESYLASGTMYKNASLGGVNFLVCATFGEKGKHHIRRAITGRELKMMRKAELLKVSSFLRVERLFAPGLPDGNVEKRMDRLVVAVEKAVEAVRPDCIISFGPDGITGHHDHIATGNVAAFVSAKYNVPLFTFTFSPRVCRGAHKWLDLRRKSPHYRDGRLEHGRATFKIPIDEAVKRKALSFHKSQLDSGNPFHNFPDYVVKDLLTAEYFCKC